MIGDPVPLHAKHGEGDRPQDGGGVSTVRQARRLRRNLSLPERLLWRRLRGRANGIKFRRQHPVGGYILDFYCPAARLVVEIDGQSHQHGEQPQRDERRTAYLRSHGLTVVRLPAAEVLADPDTAADSIVRAAMPLHRPAAGPPPHAAHGEDLQRGAV